MEHGQRRGPGSMTMAMRAVGAPSERAEVIRLGLVSSEGRLEERVVPLSAPVVIGPSAEAAIVVPSLATPHVLLSREGDRVILHVGRAMKARVASASGARDLEGRDEDVVLDARGRGRIVIGPTTLLFQLAALPPKRLPAALPASVRGGFFRQLDAIFTAVVACSFLGHFGFVVFLESADWPMSPGLAQVPDHVAEMIFEDEPPPSPPDETPETPPDEAPETPPEEAPPEVAQTHETPTRGEPTDRTRPPSMSREDATLAVSEATSRVRQLLIGASGAPSAYDDMLATGAPTQAQADLFGQVEGVLIATNEQMPRQRDGSTHTGPSELGRLRRVATQTGPVDEGRELVEQALRTTWHPPAPDDIEIRDAQGEFDERAVVRMIQSRRAMITACYEHAILSDPTLRGRIQIEMTIEESGSVSGVHTIDNGMGSDVVARCVETRIRAFRFTPGPTGGSVQFRFPFVFDQQR